MPVYRKQKIGEFLDSIDREAERLEALIARNPKIAFRRREIEQGREAAAELCAYMRATGKRRSSCMPYPDQIRAALAGGEQS